MGGMRDGIRRCYVEVVSIALFIHDSDKKLLQLVLRWFSNDDVHLDEQNLRQFVLLDFVNLFELSNM
jgi:NADPH-dependent 7-cyano-7-deazaguanine reductase QueF-like protein